MIAGILAGMLAGCGGGGGNSDNEMVRGGNLRPDPMPTPSNDVMPDIEQANPNANDISEHWRNNDSIVHALGANDSTNTMMGLERALGERDEENYPASSLGNIAANNMRTIGARGNIQIGRWTNGPANRFDIDFYFDGDANLSAADRARVERAGKLWSKRITSDFVERSVGAGTDIGGRDGTESGRVDTHQTVDDMLIVVNTTTQGIYSYGGPELAERGKERYEPWFGQIVINTANGHESNTGVIAHEIGHVVAFTDSTLGGWEIPTVERYLSTGRDSFEGPRVMRENDGNPLPFQWVNSGLERVEPGTPGATIDLGHPDICDSIMSSYCRYKSGKGRETPAEIDFAYLEDIGYDIATESESAGPEVYGYGAWAEHSAWGVGVARYLDGTEAGNDRLEASTFALGIGPTTPLSEGNVTGNAMWQGVLLGVDTGHVGLAPVSGSAEISVNLATMNGHSAFDDLTVHTDGTSRAFRSPSLRYDITVEGNSFSDEDSRVTGGFYGPGHEETAGVVNDTRTTVNLQAAFGGTRKK